MDRVLREKAGELDGALYNVGDIPKQMKYISEPSVALYHFSSLARPFSIAGLRDANFGRVVKCFHLACRHSRIGRVQPAVGTVSDENDACAA